MPNGNNAGSASSAAADSADAQVLNAPRVYVPQHAQAIPFEGGHPASLVLLRASPSPPLQNRAAVAVLEDRVGFSVGAKDRLYRAGAHHGADSVGPADHVAVLEVGAGLAVGSHDGKHVRPRAKHGGHVAARPKERARAGLWKVVAAKHRASNRGAGRGLVDMIVDAVMRMQVGEGWRKIAKNGVLSRNRE